MGTAGLEWSEYLHDTQLAVEGKEKSEDFGDSLFGEVLAWCKDISSSPSTHIKSQG